MTFSDLNINKPLLKALAHLTFETPTPIQEKAFPIIMSGKDVVAIAQTGTGKTFAYLLPILRQLTFSEQKQPRVLILVPTRELVVQVVGEIEKLTNYMNVRCAGIYGGANINTQKQTVYNGLDILVSTPGRLNDLILTRSIQLHSIKKLVIDEVDEMLNLGFRAQLFKLMEALPEKRQNLLFSATLDEDVERLIANFFVLPEYVEIIKRGTPLEKIKQSAYYVPNFFTKINLLEHLLQTDKSMKRVLVFVKNKKLADALYTELEPAFKELTGVIHSNKSQPQRFNAIKYFQDGTHRMLIATDIISRGLDIPEVSHVINFDTPNDPNDYIHRIGRTGRADSIGASIAFIAPPEKEYQKAIEALMKKKISMQKMPEEVIVNPKLTPDEKPVKKDKNLHKFNKPIEIKGAAFHEKKIKNKKTPQVGKRRQERARRATLAFIRKKGSK